MKIHELKTDPDCFEASWNRWKPFEVRLNDRFFHIGDQLLLRETTLKGGAIKAGAPLNYTGRQLSCYVTYILEGPRFGIAPGWCVMGVSFDAARKP